MERHLITRLLLPVLLVVSAVADIGVGQEDDPTLEDNQCVACHGTEDLWEEDTLHLFVPAKNLTDDIHWKKGIRCQDCHGGNSDTFDLREAHSVEDGFRDIETPADVPAFCGHCHSDQEKMQQYEATIGEDPVTAFWEGVHGRQLKESGEENAATCLSCHPKHVMRPATDRLSAVHPTQLTQTCGDCHQEQRNGLLSDVHSKAGGKDETGAATALDCSKCHGVESHRMLPVSDPKSPVFVNNQVERCGSCHEEDLESYLVSVHGHGLLQSGLLSTAVCSSCHGAHGIYPAENTESMLHVTQVAATCAQCHRFIEERLQQSVHGRGNGPGGATQEAAPGGDVMRTPSCTDCHQKHDAVHPGSPQFRQEMADRCGDCHQELSHQFAISVHGELTELGFGDAAKCADCHGDHEILPLDDPNSLLSPVNRAETCGKCHPGASGNFLDFDPHADHRDPERSPVLYAVYMVLLTLILGTFGFFGLHSVLWFVRSLIQVRRHGREHSWTPGAVAYIRFPIFHRLAHTALLLSFLGLALTGLPLKYSGTAWAQVVADMLGGFASTSVWHRIFGLVNVGCLAIYLVRMFLRLVSGQRAGRSLRSIIFGPDSPVPNWRDLKDFLNMVRWFFGLGPKPTFERWAYWEKVDFWGASADIVIIGLTGLILWFPYVFCAFLPGEVLNIAKVIHSTQALLATGFVFAIHFFATHLRPEKFPMDMVMLTGMVSEEELREERPDMLERLEREGRLEAIRTTIPPRRRLLSLACGGAIGLFIGLALLVGIFVGIFGG